MKERTTLPPTRGTSQQGLWAKAYTFGKARKDSKIGFNAQKISGASRVSFASEGPATAVEQMQAFAAQIGAAYHPELGIVRGAVPAPLATTAAKVATVKASKVETSETSDAIAQAFATFKGSKSFKQAFTARGRLRQGWKLVSGIPCWAGQY